jgi:hypothetical protein
VAFSFKWKERFKIQRTLISLDEKTLLAHSIIAAGIVGGWS